MKLMAIIAAVTLTLSACASMQNGADMADGHAPMMEGSTMSGSM